MSLSEGPARGLTAGVQPAVCHIQIRGKQKRLTSSTLVLFCPPATAATSSPTSLCHVSAVNTPLCLIGLFDSLLLRSEKELWGKFVCVKNCVRAVRVHMSFDYVDSEKSIWSKGVRGDMLLCLLVNTQTCLQRESYLLIISCLSWNKQSG